MAFCGMSMMKYLLFAFNLLFVISGIGLIIAGALSLKNITKYSDFMEDENTASSTLLITVGSIIFILAFLGCYGAWKESYWMLITFAVLLTIIFALELAAGIAAYVYRKEVVKTFEEIMQNDLNTNETKSGWDKIQLDLKCCGAVNVSDWSNIYKYHNGSLPSSCCDTIVEDCNTANNNWHKQGCIEALENFLQDKIYIVGSVGVGMAFIQLLGITFACCLACNQNKS
ncbi:CD63 antigen-like [Tachypleus tridentatus]|uniref:CD63 antigen-like n=1 Tax=Tachypleus tridentatus TaxID=6853 RepID=UPI003FD3B958